MIKREAQQSKNSNHDSSEAQRLQAHLSFCNEEYVMITSNMWTEVGLNNGTRGKVVDLLYKDSIGPQSGALPEVVAGQLRVSDADVVTFIPGVTDTVAIPKNQFEWLDNVNNLIHK